MLQIVKYQDLNSKIVLQNLVVRSEVVNSASLVPGQQQLAFTRPEKLLIKWCNQANNRYRVLRTVIGKSQINTMNIKKYSHSDH